MQTLTLTDSRPSGSNSARSTTRPIPHNGGNLVAHGYELLWLCCPSRPSLEHLLNGPAERGDSMAGSRLNGPWGLTYTTSGSMTSTGNPRKSLVEAANDLHGLLRHRLRPRLVEPFGRSAACAVRTTKVVARFPTQGAGTLQRSPRRAAATRLGSPPAGSGSASPVLSLLQPGAHISHLRAYSPQLLQRKRRGKTGSRRLRARLGGVVPRR